MATSSLLHNYVNVLRKYGWIVIIIWIGIGISSAFFVMKYIETTTVSFTPPDDTTVAHANRQRAIHFPADRGGQQAQLSLFAQVTNDEIFNHQRNSSSSSESASDLSSTSSPPQQQQQQQVCKKSINVTNIARSIVDIPSVALFVEAIAVKSLELNKDSSVANYYLLQYVINATDVAQQLVSPDKTVLLIPILLPAQFATQEARNFGKQIVNAQEQLQNSILRNTSYNLEFFDNDKEYVDCLTNLLTAGATGVPIMEGKMVEQSKADLAHSDAITMPIAFVVMAFTVQSLRLLILPGISIGFTIIASFALSYPIALSTPILSAAPSLQMSLTIATACDYNLFILSRFTQEVRAGHRGAAAVLNTMRTAGKTVLVSGTSLTVSFIALCFFDLELIRSFGITCSLTLVMALLVSLNLVPTLLIQFFTFFEKAAYPVPLPSCLPRWAVFEYFGFSLLDEEEIENQKHQPILTQQSSTSILNSPDNMNAGAGMPGSPVPTLEAGEDFSAAGTTTPQQFKNNNNSSNLSSASPTEEHTKKASSPTATTGRGHNPNPVIRNKASSLSQLATSPTQRRNMINNSSSNLSGNNNNNSRQQQHPAGTTTTAMTKTASFSGNSTLRSLRNFFGGNNNNNNNKNNNTNDNFDPSLNPVPSLPQISDSTPLLNNTYNNNNKIIAREATAQFGSDVGNSVFLKLQPILRFPWNILVIVVLLGLIGYVGSFTLDLKVTDQMSSYLTRGSPAQKEFMLIQEKFGSGSVFPYQFVFILDDNTNKNNSSSSSIIGSPEIFHEAQAIIQHLVNVTNTPLKNFQGIFAVGGRWTTYEQVQECEDFIHHKNKNNHTKCDGNILTMLNNMSVSVDRQAAIVSFISLVDPTGNDGKEFYDLLLRAVQYRPPSKNQSDNPKLSVYVCGVGPMSMESITSAYAFFPVIAGVTGAAMVILVAVTFKSIIVPLRCLISIALTEAFVFGMTVLVYQKGAFDFMGWASVSGAGAISWLTPIVAFLVIAGTALDYDVLLLTNIYEFITREGVTTVDGVLLGLVASAKTITSAGICMAIAFFGLLIASMRLVNELGFMLVVATLFDCLVVRVLLVPSLMSLFGKYNWWPSNPETYAFSHIFGPSDSISARASFLRRDSDALFQNNNYQQGTTSSSTGGGGADGYENQNNGNRQQYGSSYHNQGNNNSNYLHSSQYLEQQKQRLQHLFGGGGV